MKAKGFRAFDAARRTLAGYEAIHVMRKGQVRWVNYADVRRQNQFIDRLFVLPALNLVASGDPRASFVRGVQTATLLFQKPRRVKP